MRHQGRRERPDYRVFRQGCSKCPRSRWPMVPSWLLPRRTTRVFAFPCARSAAADRGSAVSSVVPPGSPIVQIQQPRPPPFSLFLCEGTAPADEGSAFSGVFPPDPAFVEIHDPGPPAVVEQQVVAIQVGMKHLSVVHLPDGTTQCLPFLPAQWRP